MTINQRDADSASLDSDMGENTLNNKADNHKTNDDSCINKISMDHHTIKKVVLAYSGGLDTSAIIPWIKERYKCEVVAFVADVGQGKDELEGIEKKAMLSGASACYVVDLNASFLSDYVWPTLKTGAIYENGYLLGTALARPVIAKAQVALARQVGADAVAHGCTGKGNDQVRFEATYAALAPDLSVIAPWREWELVSREDLLDYLEQEQVPCSASLKKIYSRDANAWHISHEGGELEDPWNAPSKEVWTWTCDPVDAPDAPEEVMLTFEAGVLSSINGQPVENIAALKTLNDLAAVHGVGRLDIVENRLIGMKSRGCYETPGGTVLTTALLALETLVLDRDTLKLRQQLGAQFGQMLYDGKWFTTAAQVILNAAADIATAVNGSVVVQLFKGQVTVLQKCSPNSLYAEAFATFGKDDVYDQKDATGFIRLHTLTSRIKALQKHASQSDEIQNNDNLNSYMTGG